MACFQYADWIEAAFDMRGNRDGFIVQKVKLDQFIDDRIHSVHYYEAWPVSKGVCEKSNSDKSNDLFCIGNPYCQFDELRNSIGHAGKVIFTPEVYWINNQSELFTDISTWDTVTVKEANGLKAKYVTRALLEMFSREKKYPRSQFIHEWSFNNPEVIYNVVLDYCKCQWNPQQEIDIKNFEIRIDELFPDNVFPEIKKLIIKGWNNK